jgi:hypothetical protein
LGTANNKGKEKKEKGKRKKKKTNNFFNTGYPAVLFPSKILIENKLKNEHPQQFSA